MYVAHDITSSFPFPRLSLCFFDKPGAVMEVSILGRCGGDVARLGEFEEEKRETGFGDFDGGV